MSFDRISNRSRKNLAVRNVAVAATDHCRDCFNTESQVGSGTANFYPISFLEQRLQGGHSGAELPVIERANVEIKILERFGAHTSQLRHGWARPAKHDPFCFLYPLILNRPHFLG